MSLSNVTFVQIVHLISELLRYMCLFALELMLREKIMCTAPFAFLQPHNQIFFQVPSRIFGTNFVCCLLMAFTINAQNFS